MNMRMEWAGAEMARRVCRKYEVDLAHAEQVAAIAGDLFAQAQALHGLSSDERDALHLAALLHDVGHFVSERGHHKHSAYIIRADAALDPLPENLREFVAAVARNHRRRPRTAPPGWSQAQNNALRWLSGFLRVADALDYEHRQQARIAAVHARGQSLEIVVAGLDPLLLGERLQEKAQLLSRVLGRQIYFRQGVG